MGLQVFDLKVLGIQCDVFTESDTTDEKYLFAPLMNSGMLVQAVFRSTADTDQTFVLRYGPWGVTNPVTEFVVPAGAGYAGTDAFDLFAALPLALQGGIFCTPTTCLTIQAKATLPTGKEVGFFSMGGDF